MSATEHYKARLIFAAKSPGVFNWRADSQNWYLPSGKLATLYARGAAELKDAQEFHIDVAGFESPEAARETGEQVRESLRLANAVLGLGLMIPTSDAETPRARLAAHIKEQISTDHGIDVVDCVFGLNVLREGAEAEFVLKGDLIVRSKDSAYILETASQLWDISNRLDSSSALAIELLNSGARDSSHRSRFLITFLALDMVLERRQRSEGELEILKELSSFVDRSSLESAEKTALRSFLGGWKSTSLRAEIDRLSNHGDNAEVLIGDEQLPVFLHACVKLRHKLSHAPKETAGWEELEREAESRIPGLRRVVLNVVWARNRLPDLTVKVPGDTVAVTEMTATLL